MRGAETERDGSKCKTPPANLSAWGGALSTLWDTLERRCAALTPTEQADSFCIIGVCDREQAWEKGTYLRQPTRFKKKDKTRKNYSIHIYSFIFIEGKIKIDTRT